MIARREWIKPAPPAPRGRVVGHVMGHRLTLELDDAVITAELRKRGVGGKVENEVRQGRSWLLAYPTEHGLDVCLWLGKAGDSGFACYHLAGVAPVCTASLRLLTSLRGMVGVIDHEEYFEKGSSQPSLEPGC
jgi:hypothetical protein